MAPPVDKDLLFLECNIALVDDLFQLADQIITVTEDPDVIILARDQQRVAALLEKKLRDYWPRLRSLKAIETQNGPLPPNSEPSQIKKEEKQR